MTINDLTLNELIGIVLRQSGRLNELMRDGKEAALFQTLSHINSASDLAMDRLNRLKWPPKKTEDTDA
jgi:hypothetical protein